MKLEIKTLGIFDIRLNGNSVIKKSKQACIINKLLQYFIAFRNIEILPETIMENLFSENEYSDPKSTLSTQIYRLRKLLKSMVHEGEEESKYFTISAINGNYILEVGEKVEIDVDKFEELIKQGDQIITKNPDEALEIYYKALDIYGGFFLSEYAYEVWLIPLQNYYNRLYLKAIFQTINLLKKNENYDEIIRICEKALYFEPYDEDIHICFMEAMLKQGQFTSVLKHYDYIVNLLKKEMDINSSPKLNKFYEKIESTLSEKRKMSAIDFWNRIELEENEGAKCCDFRDFKAIIDNQKRKSERNTEADYVVILSNESEKNDGTNSKIWVKEMTQILKNILRKGDIFTVWNEKQIIILLHDVKYHSLIIEKRLRNKIRNCPKIAKIRINIESNPILEGKLDEKEISG